MIASERGMTVEGEGQPPAPDAGGTRFGSAVAALSSFAEYLTFAESFVESERLMGNANPGTCDKLRHMLRASGLREEIATTKTAFRPVIDALKKFTGGSGLQPWQVHGVMEALLSKDLHPQLRDALQKRWVHHEPMWRTVLLFHPTFLATTMMPNQAPPNINEQLETLGVSQRISDRAQAIYAAECCGRNLEAQKPVEYWCSIHTRYNEPASAELLSVARRFLGLRPTTANVEGLISKIGFLQDPTRNRLSSRRASLLVCTVGNRDLVRTLYGASGGVALNASDDEDDEAGIIED